MRNYFFSSFLHRWEGSGEVSPNCLCIYFLLSTSRVVPLTSHCELIHYLIPINNYFAVLY